MLDVCRLKKIRDNIANYKTAEKVTLLAATKTIPPEEVEALFDAGIVTAGENRVQEFIAKYDKVSRPIDWQFIGRLQINKVKYIVDKVSLIQSVDSEKLAAEINKQACKSNIVMPVLLEVNMGREAGKGGVIPEEADNECAIIQTYKNVRLDGIMCVFPKNAKENLYAEAESLYNRLQEKYNLKILSMGMSDDYVTALKHGANMIRLGRAIFGERGKFYER